MSFPKDFIWGAAAVSYQIEGAAFSIAVKGIVFDPAKPCGIKPNAPFLSITTLLSYIKSCPFVPKIS